MDRMYVSMGVMYVRLEPEVRRDGNKFEIVLHKRELFCS